MRYSCMKEIRQSEFASEASWIIAMAKGVSRRLLMLVRACQSPYNDDHSGTGNSHEDENSDCSPRHTHLLIGYRTTH